MEFYPGFEQPTKRKRISQNIDAKRQSTINNLVLLEVHKLIEENSNLIMGTVRGRLFANGIETDSTELRNGIWNAIDKIATKQK